MSYFDTNDFKGNLTPEQIQVAPRLQSIREGQGDAPFMLNRLQTVGGVRQLIDARGRVREYDLCMDTLNGVSDPLPDNTLLTVSRAAVPFEAVEERARNWETEVRACDAGDVGRKMFRRATYQSYSAMRKRVGEPRIGPWVEFLNHCTPGMVIQLYELHRCENNGVRGVVKYTHWAKQVQDPADPTKTVYSPSLQDGTLVPDPVLVQDVNVGNCSGTFPPQKTLPPSKDVTTRETGALSCNAAYGWSGGLVGTYTRARTRREREFTAENWSTPIRQVIYSDWGATSDNCRQITLSDSTEYRTLSCPTGYQGGNTQRRILRKTVTNYVRPDFADSSSTAVYSGWTTTSYSCTLIPPPPSPSRDEGGGNNGGGEGSVDVNRDGRGDYAIGDPRGAGGKEVGGDCGACNGPSGGGGGEGGEGGGGKIICTAMNAAYGFGSYRQAIWLAHAARDMTPYHQTGYHLLALPLIRTAYGSDSRTARLVRSSIEHMARERTADIRAEMRGGKRRRLGRAYRAVLEPLCYITGWLAGGRSIDAIKDVPVIAAALRDRTSPKKGHIHA